MSEKVFKEYCEDCGCPLDICCKPKVPVVSKHKFDREMERKNKRIKRLLELLKNQGGEKEG